MNTFLLSVLCFLCDALTGEEKRNAETEGSDVTLPTNVTKLHKDDVIQWWYEDKDEKNLIAKVDKVKKEKHVYGGADGRFRSKLAVKDETGDLKITDIRTIHSGLYKVKISSSKRTKYKTIFVPVTVKTVKVNPGDPYTFPSNNEIQGGDLVLWTFGAEKSLIVKVDSEIPSVGERFKDRLELDKLPGTLTIRNMETTDSGHYKQQIINSKETTIKRFNVIVENSTGNRDNESEPLLKHYQVATSAV
ncbi:uncharacterized protein [Garra rufa]|uniref:uncharacterized protein n=1 Tax=Garra rufa TaxID=137080 RepID=UPI003CCE9456